MALLIWAAAMQLATALPTAEVHAIGETQAVASAKDAADDPAIWRDRKHPDHSLIVATDKQAGLNVYDLSGALRFTLSARRVNNVDLRTVRLRGGKKRIIVAASDRSDPQDARLALFELDPQSAALTPLAHIPVASGEAYGLCLYQPRGEALNAFIVMKDGAIAQAQIDVTDNGVSARVVRRMKLATQSEGCVADDRTGTLYVAEEDVGIWRFGANAADPVAGELVAPADGSRLVADAEGLAIATKGRRGGWLVASSQGDSAYTVYRLPALDYVGRFRIAAGAKIDGTSDTDGIEISTRSFGDGKKGGIMIAQDGNNAPEAQNFKIVRWPDVRAALKLK